MDFLEQPRNFQPLRTVTLALAAANAEVGFAAAGHVGFLDAFVARPHIAVVVGEGARYEDRLRARQAVFAVGAADKRLRLEGPAKLRYQLLLRFAHDVRRGVLENAKLVFQLVERRRSAQYDARLGFAVQPAHAPFDEGALLGVFFYELSSFVGELLD